MGTNVYPLLQLYVWEGTTRMQPGANSVKTYSHFQANPCILALAVHVRISNINGYRPLDESHHIDVVVEIVLPDVTAIHWHTLRQPIILNVWRPLVDIFCNKPKSYILEGRFIITKHAREGRKAKKKYVRWWTIALASNWGWRPSWWKRTTSARFPIVSHSARHSLIRTFDWLIQWLESTTIERPRCRCFSAPMFTYLSMYNEWGKDIGTCKGLLVHITMVRWPVAFQLRSMVVCKCGRLPILYNVGRVCEH